MLARIPSCNRFEFVIRYCLDVVGHHAASTISLIGLEMPELSPDMERHSEIKLGLREVGSSLSQIASELGLKNSTITVVSQGYRKSHSVQAAIARKLGLKPEQLFPERYEEEETKCSNS